MFCSHTHYPAGTDAQRILVVCMKQLAETQPMGAFDHKGHCIYANSPLAAMLGYNLKVLKTKDITQLLPQPYGVMHLKHLKVGEGRGDQVMTALWVLW